MPNLIPRRRSHLGSEDYRRTRTPARAQLLVTVFARAIAALDPRAVHHYASTEHGPTGLIDAAAVIADPGGRLHPVNIEDLASALQRVARGRTAIPLRDPWAHKIRLVNTGKRAASALTAADCLRLLMIAVGDLPPGEPMPTEIGTTDDATTTLIRDEPWTYPGHCGTARRRLRVWQRHPVAANTVVAVLSEHHHDPGTSITEAAQAISLNLEREYPDDLLQIIEHYPDNDPGSRYSLVSLDAVLHPRWRHLPDDEARALLPGLEDAAGDPGCATGH